MYDWAELQQTCAGNWEDIIKGLSNVDPKFFNGKHQPCPCCGGKDRARWINKKEVAYCNQCGGRDGSGSISPINMIMDLNGWGFKDAVEEIGNSVNAIPTKKLIANKRIHIQQERSNLVHNVSNQDLAIEALAKATNVPFCKLSMRHIVAPDSLLAYEGGILVPMFDAIGELKNAAHIHSDELVSFIAGSITYGTFNKVGQDTGKSVFVCCDYFDACIVNKFTGCQVLYCVTAINAKLVINELNDKRIHWAANYSLDELYEAEKASCKVVLAVGGDIKESRKLENKFTDITSLFDDLEAID